ncbi:uncharacterized protein EAE98_009671 [Botrytis deweyae]|uniref:NADAR domain-containing protein n=1 Tax=Botrytis deweyae TaxID=2478750 RepID=A0ABQ7IB87_9HELO|nr:uncharacterized protein EAE98_009671 [Botrytis deweyae]KAF7918893.1 hypothetical protein EAE98_009671 [Botrytis deweyae]
MSNEIPKKLPKKDECSDCLTFGSHGCDVLNVPLMEFPHTFTLKNGKIKGHGIFLGSNRHDKYDFLKSSYPSSFEDSMGRQWYHSEGFIQGAKAIVMNDHKLSETIRKERDPEKAKKLGEMIQLDLTKWTRSIQIAVMKQSILYKFEASPNLRKKLKETIPQPIVEVSPDNIWGSGLGMKATKQTAIAQWPGNNLFGILLMQFRVMISLDIDNESTIIKYYKEELDLIREIEKLHNQRSEDIQSNTDSVKDKDAVKSLPIGMEKFSLGGDQGNNEVEHDLNGEDSNDGDGDVEEGGVLLSVAYG